MKLGLPITVVMTTKAVLMNHPLKHLLARLLNHISARRKKQFALLSVLMILASFVEVVSIGAVLPFIGMLTAPQQVFHHPYSQPIVQMLGLTEPRQLYSLLQ